MSSKIFFNKIPKKPCPFPMFEFDCELDIDKINLGCSVNDNITFRSVNLFIEGLGNRYPIGEIKLYHSGNTYNFERTFDSAHFLALEICRRFNNFNEKGQQCLKFS